MKTRILLTVAVLLGLLVLYGCSPKTQAPTGAETTTPPSPAASGPSAPTAAAPTGVAGLTGVALGKQIFTKGIGSSGKHLAFTEGSDRFKAHPEGCAGCHKPDGSGRKLKTHIIPAIKYSALFEPQNGKPALFTMKTIHNPIEGGLRADGKPLKKMMPRWQMSNDELQALVDYLKTLDTMPPAAAGPKPAAGASAPASAKAGSWSKPAPGKAAAKTK